MNGTSRVVDGHSDESVRDVCHGRMVNDVDGCRPGPRSRFGSRCGRGSGVDGLGVVADVGGFGRLCSGFVGVNGRSVAVGVGDVVHDAVDARGVAVAVGARFGVVAVAALLMLGAGAVLVRVVVRELVGHRRLVVAKGNQ